jgi:serine phosphatase RsbU (regulator of sigma subunit)
VSAVGHVISAIEAAAPDAVSPALAVALEKAIGSSGVTVLLPDYHLATLHPVDDPERAIGVDSTWEGRIFASQRHDVRTAVGGDGMQVGVPITLRGDRLGVLVVQVESGPRQEELEELELIASAVGRALRVAERSTDAYATVRRSRPLTVAAELQWALLPGVSFAGPGFAIAAQLEPAYSVAGDAYDWSLTGSTLTLLACDGAGRGVPAALASSIALTALRNARREGLPLADQAALADQALYAQFGGEQFVSTLLMSLDTGSGRLEIIDAGSPQLWMMRRGELTEAALEAQLPLGMFEETHYDSQFLMLEPGDRVLVLSDGVLAERAGATGLAVEPTLRGTRLLAADETVRHVMRELARHHDNHPLDDDAVVLCLDWTGPLD